MNFVAGPFGCRFTLAARRAKAGRACAIRQPDGVRAPSPQPSPGKHALACLQRGETASASGCGWGRGRLRSRAGRGHARVIKEWCGADAWGVGRRKKMRVKPELQ